MKRLVWLLLLGLFGVGSYLLGLLWPPDQVVAALFGRAELRVLLVDAGNWVLGGLVVGLDWAEEFFIGLPVLVQFAIGFLFVCGVFWLLWYLSVFTLVFYGAFVVLKSVCWFFSSLWEWFCGLFDS